VNLDSSCSAAKGIGLELGILFGSSILVSRVVGRKISDFIWQHIIFGICTLSPCTCFLVNDCDPLAYRGYLIAVFSAQISLKCCL